MKTLIQSVMTPHFLLASVLCGGCIPALAGDTATPSPVPSARLVEVGHEDETGPIVFDMGELEQMDDGQRNKDFQEENKFLPWQPGYHRVLRGAKHVFQLKNIGTRDIRITRVEDNSLFVEADVVEGDTKIAWPYTVKPGDTVDFLFAFDYYLSSPGPVREQVNLYEADSTQPISTLVMQGKVNSGINFLEPTIDFGEVKVMPRSREFTLIFDKRLPKHMIFPTLKLISSIPDVSIQSLDAGKVIMGVKVEKDRMFFPIDVTFPKELRLRFRAILSDKAPVGIVKGRIDLIMSGAPYAAIVRNLGIPIKGEVTDKR
ncbi:hypothetical protein IAD21_05118 [Abditibacteriota bacterium]|nr:hypothetical protein IAD21_05118 [Abditibacteriota bacterium]